MRRWLWLLLVVSLVGCPKDVTRTPVPQEDVLIVGRLLALKERPQEPGVFDVTVRLAVPEALKGVMRKEGRPIPESEKEMVAQVKVDRGSVCVVEGQAAELSQLRVGQEVVVVPVSGSCAMVGDRELLADAAEIYEFRSYQLRALPKSLETIPDWVNERRDPQKINSSGKEVSPIPLAGGKVLYFSAGLLPPLRPQDPPRGALRPGMTREGKLLPWAEGGGVRPYRTEYVNGAWKPPQPVVFPNLPEDASLRVSWVSEDERSLLAELRLPGQDPQLVQATWNGAWGPLEPVPETAGKATGDGQRFGKKGQALVWTVYEYGASDLYLKMEGTEARPLEPRINTANSEWAPRVGPNTTLYFCRGDRQLLFAKQTIQEVRLPGTCRHPFSEAAPTANGQLLFFRVPRFTAGEPDWDLAVAQRQGEGWGQAIPLDEFRFP
jgi:hypothetical protein